MAVFNGTSSTKAFINTPTENVETIDAEGRVRILYDEYIIPAASAPGAADTINMGGLLIPKGARIVDAWIGNDGDISSGTSLLALELVTTAGTKVIVAAHDGDAGDAFSRMGVLGIEVAGFKLDSDGQIQLNPTGDVDTATSVIKVAVFYVVD